MNRIYTEHERAFIAIAQQGTVFDNCGTVFDNCVPRLHHIQPQMSSRDGLEILKGCIIVESSAAGRQPWCWSNS